VDVCSHGITLNGKNYESYGLIKRKWPQSRQRSISLRFQPTEKNRIAIDGRRSLPGIAQAMKMGTAHLASNS